MNSEATKSCEDTISLISQCLQMVDKQIQQKKESIMMIQKELLSLVDDRMSLTAKLFFEELRLKELVNGQSLQHNTPTENTAANVYPTLFQLDESTLGITTNTTALPEPTNTTTWTSNEETEALIKNLQDFASGILPQNRDAGDNITVAAPETMSTQGTTAGNRSAFSLTASPEKINRTDYHRDHDSKRRRVSLSPSSTSNRSSTEFCTSFNIAHGVQIILESLQKPHCLVQKLPLQTQTRLHRLLLQITWTHNMLPHTQPQRCLSILPIFQC
jgi:hypothetical protein